MKGIWQEGMEKYFGSSQGPNWAAEPLMEVVVVVQFILYLYCSITSGGFTSSLIHTFSSSLGRLVIDCDG
jgi:hypothetical protein